MVSEFLGPFDHRPPATRPLTTNHYTLNTAIFLPMSLGLARLDGSAFGGLGLPLGFLYFALAIGSVVTHLSVSPDALDRIQGSHGPERQSARPGLLLGDRDQLLVEIRRR